ncbi:MAG: recombinase family protein [Lachnospiraceae bacterium]|nr:recombinase family protein [Lachnospiraceae bacterium]
MLIAIYSRKSKWTGKGDSVENQLIMCREYINTFVEGGKDAEIIEYEDEGFSGKNTKRPQFQKMMNDMQSKHYDYLVCYKLDRLGRNLADLATLMEQLERKETSFISIKEKFDTTTPIGKAMLYFSGVLAQMEREQIAERVRDNMVMLARNGRWLGGNTPLGFESQKLEKETATAKKKTFYCLVQNPEEIRLVSFIFKYFLEHRSLTKVMRYLLTNGIKTRAGNDFGIMTIRDILTNPVYCKADKEAYHYFYDLGCQVCIDEEELDNETGLMSYAKTSSSHYKNQAVAHDSWIISKGRHKGIVSGKDFVRIQQLLEENKDKGACFRRGRNNVALLSGILYCTCGNLMRPKNYPESRVNEKGERTFAYLCPYKENTHGQNCQNKNVHGNTLDEAVCNEIVKLASPDEGAIPLLEELKKQIEASDDEVVSEKQILIQERDKKKEEIRKLVNSMKQMGDNSISIEYVEKEISKLDKECKELDKKIKSAEDDSFGKTEVTNQLEEMAEKLSDFQKLFPTFSLEEKREFVRSIVEKVVWDGELAHIHIHSPVRDPHRAFLSHMMERIILTSLPKFPNFNHRIATTTWPHDCQKFSFFHLKTHTGNSRSLPF